MENVGIQETKEAVVASIKLGKFIAAQAKDGLDLKDAGALAAKIAGDAEFRGALLAGFEGASKIPAEVKDLDFSEGILLAQAVVEELKKPV